MGSIAIVDWIIAAIIAFSSLISIKRGFVREALSLITLVVAMIISRLVGPQFAGLLIHLIEVDSVRNVVAYLSLFFATLIVGGFVNSLVVQAVRVSGMAGMDKFLGMAFGFARGALIIAVIVALLARMGVSGDDWWRDSLLIPEFVEFGDWLQMIGWENADELLRQVQLILSPNQAPGS